MTWAKLSAIEANCGIETTLDACMLRVSEVAAAKKRVRSCRSASPQSHTQRFIHGLMQCVFALVGCVLHHWQRHAQRTPLLCVLV